MAPGLIALALALGAGPTAGSGPHAQAQALLADATHAIQAGQLDVAVAELGRCRRLDPALAACPRALGIAYGRRGDGDAAARAYVAYLAVAPTAADAPHVRELIAAYRGR